MPTEHIAYWLKVHPLAASDIDCVITIMLKILDGKCKMATSEKTVITLVYDQIKPAIGIKFDQNIHLLIAEARTKLDDENFKLIIYEQRLLAETAISRPVMKKFKAYIRETGLLTPSVADD